MNEHPPSNETLRALSTARAQLRRSFERFGPLPDAVWNDVREPWHLTTVARGTVLTHAGEVERRFALIIEGVQRMYFTTPSGDEHTVAFAYTGDYSGVPDSFFLQTPADCSLEALTDGYLLATDHARFSALMDEHRELERWAWRLFAYALAGRFKREREHLTMSAAERYARLLRESPQIVQLAPLRHVASYLGMSPETLSRVRTAIS